MKTRIISGLIMAPLLVLLYLGGVWLWAATFILAMIAVHEFCSGWNNMNVKVNEISCMLMTALLFGTFFMTGMTQLGPVTGNTMLMTMWLFAAVTLSLIYGWRLDERSIMDSLATLTTMVYIPFFLYHMVLLGSTQYSLFVWIVIIAAFGQDICAYFTGCFLGRHKMSPNLSPKKTIEGAVGGLAGSSLLSMLFGIIFMKDAGLSNPALICFVLGLLGGAAGMAGDLTASMFKRRMDIKDYGALIPGHGGILDRFDSVIFAAPVIYYAICIMTMTA